MEAFKEFERYIAHLSEGLGHADRHAGLKGYCTGLMLPLGRKSVEPMAAGIDPLHVSARHQALHHFVAKSEWSDATVMAGVRDWILPLLGLKSGCYWIIDDTGFPKKGKHSVGVARQYCGQLGRQDNCQVAVSLSLASVQGSIPIAYQLYLPKDWAGDATRRQKAGVPENIAFATKPEIALAQMRQALSHGVLRAIARSLQRSVSTISRELKRCGQHEPRSGSPARPRSRGINGYWCEQAHKRACQLAAKPRTAAKLVLGNALW